MHFPICLIANALFANLGFTSPTAAVFGLFLAWTASIAGGTLFYRWIESPVASRSITIALSRGFSLVPRATAALVAFLIPQRKP